MLRTPAWSLIWTVLRLIMAVLIAAAVIAQFTESMSRAAGRGGNLLTVGANFFSFFTILSNVGSVAVLVWAALWYVSRGRRAEASGPAAESRALAVALASVTTYMIVTGIVYNLLLRGVQLYPGTEPIWWSNEILHAVGPVFLLVDLFVGPLRRSLPWRVVRVVIIFPIVWVLYTLARGPLVSNPNSDETFWYPYPFLDPNRFEIGYLGVFGYVVGIAVAITAIAFFVIWIGRRRAARGTEKVAAGMHDDNPGTEGTTRHRR